MPDIASLQLKEIQTKGLQTSRHDCDSDYTLLIIFNQPTLLPLEGFEKNKIKITSTPQALPSKLLGYSVCYSQGVREEGTAEVKVTC